VLASTQNTMQYLCFTYHDALKVSKQAVRFVQRRITLHRSWQDVLVFDSAMFIQVLQKVACARAGLNW